MDITKEEMILMRAITWMSEDASDGMEEAQEIIEGLKEIIKLHAITVSASVCDCQNTICMHQKGNLCMAARFKCKDRQTEL